MGKRVKKRKKSWVQCLWCGYKPTGKLSWRRMRLLEHWDHPLGCDNKPEAMAIPIEPIAEVIE